MHPTCIASLLLLACVTACVVHAVPLPARGRSTHTTTNSDKWQSTAVHVNNDNAVGIVMASGNITVGPSIVTHPDVKTRPKDTPAGKTILAAGLANISSAVKGGLVTSGAEVAFYATMGSWKGFWEQLDKVEALDQSDMDFREKTDKNNNTDQPEVVPSADLSFLQLRSRLNAQQIDNKNNLGEGTKSSDSNYNGGSAAGNSSASKDSNYTKYMNRALQKAKVRLKEQYRQVRADVEEAQEAIQDDLELSMQENMAHQEIVELSLIAIVDALREHLKLPQLTLAGDHVCMQARSQSQNMAPQQSLSHGHLSDRVHAIAHETKEGFDNGHKGVYGAGELVIALSSMHYDRRAQLGTPDQLQSAAFVAMSKWLSSPERVKVLRGDFDHHCAGAYLEETHRGDMVLWISHMFVKLNKPPADSVVKLG